MPDADKYGDIGSNTLKNTAEAVGGLKLPVLESLGLGCIDDFKGIAKVNSPKGFFGKMKELSNAKDTTSGHWEMTGIVLERPFPTYPDGFPEEIVEAFESEIDRKIIGNYPASGTEIIKSLGEEHMQTGYPIVYTSADSVFQIAAHENIIPTDELYDMCHKARAILQYPHNVCRVIARPFTGEGGVFKRTKRRKDFSLLPPSDTILDELKKKHIDVIGIGKIGDIFCEKGLTMSCKTRDNKDGMKKIKSIMNSFEEGLLFANLIDFDMIYGHRNDPEGYAEALQRFDSILPEIIDLMKKDDMLIITADHGCDPTTPGTDHSREYVPLLVYIKSVLHGKSLGIRNTLADIGATIADVFSIKTPEIGGSFLNNIIGG